MRKETSNYEIMKKSVILTLILGIILILYFTFMAYKREEFSLLKYFTEKKQ